MRCRLDCWHLYSHKLALPAGETAAAGTWLVVGVKGVALLRYDFLHQPQGTLKVHVVAHTLGLPTEHGRVAAKARLKLRLG